MRFPCNQIHLLFLSTPSARRATPGGLLYPPGKVYFYPRPPRGGRPVSCLAHAQTFEISIHALREEGDLARVSFAVQDMEFLSTPSARRATVSSGRACRGSADFYPRPPRGGRRQDRGGAVRRVVISIHALREEGDTPDINSIGAQQDFYPRPPRGGRRSLPARGAVICNFYPRPPRGGRPSLLCGFPDLA